LSVLVLPILHLLSYITTHQYTYATKCLQLNCIYGTKNITSYHGIGIETINLCHKCLGRTMIVWCTYIRKNRLQATGEIQEINTIKCIREWSQTYRSIKKQMHFFRKINLNVRCNLKFNRVLTPTSLGQILELIYYWSQDLPIITVNNFTSRSNTNFVDWFDLCMELSHYVLFKLIKLF